MAQDSFKIKKSLNIVPQSGTSNLSEQGDLGYDSAADKLAAYSSASGADYVVSEARAQSLTNKTINADSNTITNIDNADIKALAAIDASKIADGSVSNAEFQYLANVTSDIQSQINAIDSDASEVLTNKTIDGDDNTLQDIALSSLKTVLADANKFLVRGASGEVISNTKAVPSGVVVGDTDSQTLTNKILTSPVINTADFDGGTASNSSRMTLPKASKATLNGLTRKEGTLLYASDEDIVYKDDGSTLSPLGGNFVAYSNENITDASTISLSLVVGLQFRRVTGNGGAVTAANAPFGSSAPSDGTVIRLVGQNSTNTVTLVYADSAKGCLLNGNCVLGLGSSLDLMYDATLDRYIEISRNG